MTFFLLIWALLTIQHVSQFTHLETQIPVDFLTLSFVFSYGLNLILQSFVFNDKLIFTVPEFKDLDMNRSTFLLRTFSYSSISSICILVYLLYWATCSLSSLCYSSNLAYLLSLSSMWMFLLVSSKLAFGLTFMHTFSSPELIFFWLESSLFWFYTLEVL